MQLRKITRKLQAVAALLALLLASVPTLADAFSSADMPACCNSMDCPMRPGQICGSQKHASDYAGMGNGCSMCSCDMSPKPILEIAPFVLAIPLAIHSQMIAEPAPAFVPGFLFSRGSVPSIPPPRTYPS